jgi:hypothetical protein
MLHKNNTIKPADQTFAGFFIVDQHF